MRQGKPVQVYLSDGERQALEELANEIGRTLSAEILHAIRRHLAAPPVLSVPVLGETSAAPAPKRGRPKKTT